MPTKVFGEAGEAATWLAKQVARAEGASGRDELLVAHAELVAAR